MADESPSQWFLLRLPTVVSIFSLATLLISLPAHAYIGLGPLIPVIGFSLAFIFVIGATVFGFLAYPFKKFYDFLRRAKKGSSTQSDDIRSSEILEPRLDTDESPFCSRKDHGFMTALSAIENHLIKDRVTDTVKQPIFVCGLARSGTTVVTEIINLHSDTGSFLYKDLPFPRIPYFWNFVNDWYYRGTRRKPRIHGDQLEVAPDSPDAFEELIWMAHLADYAEREYFDLVSNRFRCEQLEDDLSRAMKKILFVRGEKSRYLAKGNYNVLRLKYISQMFPDAKFVICFRNPLQQCRSLERVHRRFKELSNDSKSFDKELRAMGHFEFGNSRKPIKINQSDFDDTLNYWDAGDDYSGYLAQWISVYGTVLDDYLVGSQHQQNMFLLHYDQFVQNGKRSVGLVFNFCELEVTDTLIQNSMNKIELGQQYPESPVNSLLETRALDLYKQLSNFSGPWRQD